MKAFYLLLAIILSWQLAASQALQRDKTFNNNDTTANASTRCVAVQADGRIVYFGDNTFYNGQWPDGKGIPINYGGRLNADGTYDASFSPISLDGRIDDVEIQPFDQKILIAGSFTMVNGQPRGGVARLNTDGTLDPTFNTGIGIKNSRATTRAWCLEVKEATDPAKSKIFIGGDFQEYDGVTTGSVVRLNLDGSLDKTYKPKVVDYGVVYDMVYDKANDFLYIGGEFYTVDDVDICRLARLKPDGKLDLTYRIGPTTYNRPHSSVTSLFLNADGKLLAGGYFDKVNNIHRGGLARFNLDGTLDMNFNTGVGFQGGTTTGTSGTEVRSILVLGNGSVIAAGNFTSFNGLPCGNVVKIDANGSVDPSTTFGAGFNGMVWDIRIQRQLSGVEKVIGGGGFGYYDLEYQGAIVRLVPEITLSDVFLRIDARAEKEGALITWKTNVLHPSAEISVERSTDGKQFTVIRTANLGSFGKTAGDYSYKDPALPAAVVYYRVHIRDTEGSVYSNIERVGGIGSSLVSIFPNPVNTTLSLRSTFSKATNCNLELYDAAGALVKSWKVRINNGMQVNQFTMPDMARQQCFIRVRDEAGNILLVSKLSYVK
ncbi:MAG: hypothetical protein J7578_09185 [Chitinophagaceae bacterium]|nr:hypothetical protein [Chitinophagaceae bacterium]